MNTVHKYSKNVSKCVVGENWTHNFEVLIKISSTDPDIGGDDDILVGDGDDFVFKNDVKYQYDKWCDLVEIKKEDRESATFQNKMLSDLFNINIGVRSRDVNVGGGRERAYIGIKMKGLIE